MAVLSLQADLFVMSWLLGYVDPTEPSFVAAVLTIVFNPLFWNVVSTITLAPAGWRAGVVGSLLPASQTHGQWARW